MDKDVNIGDLYNNWLVIGFHSDKECICECQCENHTISTVSKYNLITGRSKSCGCTRYNKRKKDITDENFGDWTVIKMLPNRKALCRCVCGVEKELYHSNLTRTGSNFKCNHIGEVGKQFGNWLVLEELGNGKLLCQCQCENKTVKELYKKAVLSGETKSCGCKKFEYTNIIGKQFGEWTVLECSDKLNQKYLCQCSCENKTLRVIKKASLTHGITRSCGCKHKEHIVNTMLSRYGERCSARINNPRQSWQIEAISSRDSFMKYIQSLKYKPTIQDLSRLLDLQDSTTLLRVHEYNLEDYVIINPMYSKEETELYEYIKSITACDIKRNTKSEIENNMELDIYIPEKKLAIEFNGNYWHSTNHKDSLYHQRKTIACSKNSIRLIHVFEYEWINNNTKLKRFLHDILSDNIKIYARDTHITEVNYDCIKEFLDDNHLQGGTPSEINIILTYDNNIVAAMSFGKPRFDNNYQYELIRLCYKSGYNIAGGASKLFSYFIKKYNPDSVITYCNISKFTGQVYLDLKFKYYGITQPNYVWVDTNTNNVLSRYQTQKHNLVEKGLGTEEQTEDEIMKSYNYLKIYDCGNMKFIWNKS